MEAMLQLIRTASGSMHHYRHLPDHLDVSLPFIGSSLTSCRTSSPRSTLHFVDRRSSTTTPPSPPAADRSSAPPLLRSRSDVCAAVHHTRSITTLEKDHHHDVHLQKHNQQQQTENFFLETDHGTTYNYADKERRGLAFDDVVEADDQLQLEESSGSASGGSSGRGFRKIAVGGRGNYDHYDNKAAGGSGSASGRQKSTGEEMGAYYKEMLRADPGNPLLLRNYGRFLQEVEGDVEGAEDCYGRAILASPGDGEVLSLYGNLVWKAHRDEKKAEDYYQRAVQASPDDSYVLGSYAHFLWDAEEKEEEEETSVMSPVTASNGGGMVKAF